MEELIHSLYSYYFLVSNPRMVHWLVVECCIRISLSMHGELLDETSYSSVIKYCFFGGGLVLFTLQIIFLSVNLLAHLIHFHKLSSHSHYPITDLMMATILIQLDIL